jgi:SAM-dependent methyltransferase
MVDGDSGDFIFTKRADGSLEFKGDFEGLYQADPDPWGQSGEHPRMKDYYQFSRNRLLNTLKGTLEEFPWVSLLEVGCGNGQVVDLIHRGIEPCRVVHGCDISQTAVGRARKRFPGLEFFIADFATPGVWLSHQKRYDVVIVSQMLWYVLHGSCLRACFENALKLLTPRGYLIVQNAFLDRQEYGRGVVGGFRGLVAYALKHWSASTEIMLASYDNSDRHAPYHDGLLVLQATT